MAIKIVGIICAVCWAIFGATVAFPGFCLGPDPNFCMPAAITNPIAIISTIALAAMALVNYARRPR